MRLNNLTLTLLMAFAVAASSEAQSAAEGRFAAVQASPRAPIRSNYGALPLTFEANRGQSDPRVKFVSRGPGYTAFLTTDGMVLSLRAEQVVAGHANAAAATSSRRAVLQFRLLGAAKNPSVVGEIPQIGRVNYFIGNNPAKWQRNVPTYAQIRYKNIYPGIDLLYYGNHRQLEYDLAVAPGADPGRIQFEIKGANGIEVDEEGNLVLQTATGELHFQSPIVYQESHGQRVALQGKYALTDPTHIGFQVANYDASKPLIIDPVLVYSTYLGGSGNDQSSGIAVDSAGNVYVAGSTDSTDFPLATPGLLPSGNKHVFIAKLDATGSNLIYADYLGGNSQDYGYALALDSANNLYVTGSTASSNFPVVNPFQGTYPGSFNGFLTKISADGSSLLYSTYFGGNGSDLPSAIAVDAAGDMIIAGYTSSKNLPVANAYQSTVSANQGGMYGNYGFLTKFSADGLSLVYSTYFGGSSNVPFNCGSPCWPQPDSYIVAMALDGAGNAYVTGNTNTYNFPVTNGAYQTTDSTQLNGTVGFVSKFGGDGSLQYSTYFYDAGGVITDPTALAVDGAGSVYITGITLGSGTFPTTSTSICDPSVYGGACNYGFVTKFDTVGATLLYSTYLGPNNNATPQAIALDGNNDAYILGFTGSGTFSPVNGIESYSNGNDLLLIEIDPAASTQLFATYLGGSGNDQAAPAGMVLDANSNLYVTGITDSSDFPVTQSAFQSILGGNTDAFILKIGAASAPAASLNPASLQYASQAVGTSSQPQSVLLRNLGSSPLLISSITATGDFAETDKCGSSVAAADRCTLSITFTPTTPGSRSGTIVINDDAAGSPHVIGLSGTGLGALAVPSPASLVFASLPVGTASAAQTVTLNNRGNLTLSISSISVSEDYSQSNNCSATLAAGSTCSIQVTFIPTAAGTRSGAVTITDNAAGSPQSVGLTGTGLAQSATATLTPGSLTFASVPVGTTSAAQAVTLSNTGNTALAITSVQATGDYKQTNNCPASLSAGSTCAINVTFTPTAAASRGGTVKINDNASGSPQTVTLGGTGSDFRLANSTGNATVKAGGTATYSLTVASVGGTFANAVKLSCSGAPAQATCGLSSSSVTPGSNPATITLTVQTTGNSAELVMPHRAHSQPVFAMMFQLQGFGLFGMMLAVSKRRAKKLAVLIALFLMVGALLFMVACAGGTGIAQQQGTTPGTYTITVTGTSGVLQHSVPVTLTVQ